MSKLKISVVIPVFNEAETIAGCLEALFDQVVPADEIIVVDNGSTDDTLELLEKYKRKIHLFNEPREGVVFARTTGFDAAKGDIIGRIDADSHVSPHWVAELHRIFARSDVAATTGTLTYYDLPEFLSGVDKHLRAFAAVEKENALFLHGSNMAIRKTAWQHIRPLLCIKKGVHEDLDIAVHLREQGQKVFFASRLVVAISARRLNDSWPNIYAYAMSNMHTYETHHQKRKPTTMVVALALIIFYLPLRAIYRSYNPKKKRLSWHRFFSHRPVPRKNPLY